MTRCDRTADGALRACLGLPLARALALCDTLGRAPEVVYTGERAAGEGLTPHVIAARGGALIVSYFRDGDPRPEET